MAAESPPTPTGTRALLNDVRELALTRACWKPLHRWLTLKDQVNAKHLDYLRDRPAWCADLRAAHRDVLAWRVGSCKATTRTRPAARIEDRPPRRRRRWQWPFGVWHVLAV